MQNAWNCGLFAIRDALFDGRIPPEARGAVADGHEGTVIAWGVTREDAIPAWRAERLRARPSPPKPAEPGVPRAEPRGRGFEVRRIAPYTGVQVGATAMSVRSSTAR